MTLSTAGWLLIGLAGLSGLLTIQAEHVSVRRRVYLFKPLTTFLILLLALQIDPAVNQIYKFLIVGGLGFSLAGDVFLMLPADRFVTGLISFLLAHVLYLAAFVSSGGFKLNGTALIIYAAYGVAMLALLWPGLGDLRLPVLFYMAVILVMGWQALALWRAHPRLGTLSAALGAGLFVASDSVLALDRFRRSIPARPILVLGLYYMAQMLIALSVAR